MIPKAPAGIPDAGTRIPARPSTLRSTIPPRSWKSNETICKAFGQEWYEEQRAALLMVQSLPARLERNILINPLHPDSSGITYTMPEPVWWDERLYSKR